MVFLLTSINLLAQPPAPPPAKELGCPTSYLEAWSTVDDPDYHYQNLAYEFNICYDCAYMANICSFWGQDCNPCNEVTKIEMVYNPRTNSFETVYRIKYRKNANESETIRYTYKVIKVPVYKINQDGSKGVIVGYKFLWIPIAELHSITFNPNTNRNEMLFE